MKILQNKKNEVDHDFRSPYAMDKCRQLSIVIFTVDCTLLRYIILTNYINDNKYADISLLTKDK